jgi:PAS domain S-box-containing protein
MNTKTKQTPATNPNPVLTIDNDGTIIYSNEDSEPILNEWGVRVEEKLPSSILDLVQRVISRNSPEKIEVKAGNKVYLVMFQPLPNQECVIISGFDISEKKQAEEKLLASERNCHLLFENMLDGFAYCKMLYDECGQPVDYIYLDTNRAFEQLTGLKDVKGKRATELFSGIKESHPEVFDIYGRVALTGQSERFEIYFKPLDMWFSISVYSTEREHFVAVFDNITERKRIEAALLESEKRYRRVFTNNMVPMAVWTKSGCIIDANDAMLNLIGYTRAELEDGKIRWNEITPPEYHERDLQAISELEVHGFCMPYEKFYRHKDGHLIPIIIGGGSFDDRVGTGVLFAIDITEKKRAEGALKKARETLEEKVKERTSDLENAYNSLKESEKRLAEAQKIAHIGNWVWDIASGKEYWSDELHRIFKRNPQEAAPSYNEYFNYVHPDDRDYVANVFKGTINGKPYEIDHRIILANGEECIVHIQAEVIFNDRNIPIQTKGTVQDITERKSVEEKLRESEEKYRNIVETANEAICLINSEGVLTYVNKKMTDMTGYTIEEIIGRTIWDFVGKEDQSTCTKNMEKRRRGISESYEIKLIRKDGSTFWVLVNAKPLFDGSGKFMGPLNMLTDITERKKAEEALAKIEIARKKEIHHRIKNNLQVISSLLDLQADKFRNKKCINDSEILEAFKDSQDRVISMALIHEELYKGGGLETLNFSSYLMELAENLLQTYSVGNTDISLKMDLLENTFIDMDTAIPLGIIVNELVTNSLKHAFTGRNEGEIKVELGREENGECIKCINEDCSSTFILTVSDNGIGIPDDLEIEDLDSLGMQLVTSLVDQLDGELELKRDNGTEFIIKFMVTENNNSVSVPTIQQSD